MRKKTGAATALVLAALLLSACAFTGGAESAQINEAETPVPVTQESAAPAERANTDAATEDGAWREALEIIDAYGTSETGVSVLSYELLGETLEDCGTYYRISAVFRHAVTVPEDLEPGDTCTVTVDDLTGEQMTLTKTEDGNFTDDIYEDIFWTAGGNELFHMSADRLESRFYTGELRIRKDAEHGIAIIREYHTVTEEELRAGMWFNAVRFDGDGYVTSLVFYGD